MNKVHCLYLAIASALADVAYQVLLQSPAPLDLHRSLSILILVFLLANVISAFKNNIK